LSPHCWSVRFRFGQSREMWPNRPHVKHARFSASPSAPCRFFSCPAVDPSVSLPGLATSFFTVAFLRSSLCFRLLIRRWMAWDRPSSSLKIRTASSFPMEARARKNCRLVLMSTRALLLVILHFVSKTRRNVVSLSVMRSIYLNGRCCQSYFLFDAAASRWLSSSVEDDDEPSDKSSCDSASELREFFPRRRCWSLSTAFCNSCRVVATWLMRLEYCCTVPVQSSMRSAKNVTVSSCWTRSSANSCCKDHKSWSGDCTHFWSEVKSLRVVALCSPLCIVSRLDSS